MSSSECRDQSGPVLLKMLSLDQAARHRRVGFDLTRGGIQLGHLVLLATTLPVISGGTNPRP